MSKERDLSELYRKMEERRKLRARQPIAEKLAIAEELRDLQKALAPLRAANKAKHAAAKNENPIKSR